MYYKNFQSRGEQKIGVPVEIGDDVWIGSVELTGSSDERERKTGSSVGTVISIDESSASYTCWMLNDTFRVVSADTLVTIVEPTCVDVDAVLAEARKAAKSLPVPSLEQLQAYVDGQLTPEEMTQVGIYLTLHPDYAALVETLRNPDTVLSRAWNEKLAELVAAEKK